MRLLQAFRQRRDQYWEQQAQIDRYERILDRLRAYRDDLASYSEGNIYSRKLTLVASELTEILEGEE